MITTKEAFTTKMEEVIFSVCRNSPKVTNLPAIHYCWRLKAISRKTYGNYRSEG